MTELTAQKPIDRASAKAELARINDHIKEPLLLIGGLAVQQYHEPRNSYDIDLVCEFEIARTIAEELYLTVDWDTVNAASEHRPRMKMTHRVSGMEIHFGPKIIERGEYPHLSWATLHEGSMPFRYTGDNYLERIRVPPPHALAYTKLLSFLGRYENREKSIRDLKDLQNLVNHRTFSISILLDIIRKNGSQDIISEGMRSILEKDQECLKIINGSCLSYFMKFWPKIGHVQPQEEYILLPRTIYYAAPHRNEAQNSGVCAHLEAQGFKIKLPFDEVKRGAGTPTPNKPGLVRQICIDAIVASDGLVVDVDFYGMDTAWEIGFAEGLNKFVIGLNHEVGQKSQPRAINRRPPREHFMHGWDTQPIYEDMAELKKVIKNKIVYLGGSFKNPDAELLVAEMRKVAKSVTFPKDFISENSGMPSDYPLTARANAINQLDEADILVVMTPKYGMDTAWQIGYATAHKKVIVGVKTTADGEVLDFKNVWDHWMHGWREKDIFTGRGRLSAALRGYVDAKII